MKATGSARFAFGRGLGLCLIASVSLLISLGTASAQRRVFVTASNRTLFVKPNPSLRYACFRGTPRKLGKMSELQLRVGASMLVISPPSELARLRRERNSILRSRASTKVARLRSNERSARVLRQAIALCAATISPTPTASPISTILPSPTTTPGQPEPVYNGADELGRWSDFPLASDSRVIHVSSSLGNDANDGSAQSPKRTIQAGINSARHGYSDRVLLRRGDTFLEQEIAINRGGRSSSEPFVIGAYGDATVRPLIKTGGRSGFLVQGQEGHIDHIAFIGLHLIASGRAPLSMDFDPSRNGIHFNSSGIRSYTVGNGMLIEDCRFEYFSYGLNILSINTSGENRARNVVIRRNVINNSFDAHGHAQGIFLGELAGARVEENVVLENGYNDEIPVHDRFYTPVQDLSIWQSVADGRLRVAVDCDANAVCNEVNVSNLDFSTVTSFSDVAAVFEAGVDSALGRDGVAITAWRSPNGAHLLIARSHNNDPSRSRRFIGNIAAYSGSQPGVDLSGSNFMIDVGGQTNPTMFNHNIYSFADNLTLARNVFARASSHGFKLQPQSGFIVADNNLMLQNSIAMQLGGISDNELGVDATATRNVIMEGKDMNSDPDGERGWGLDMVNVEHGAIYGNLIANKLSNSAGHAIQFGPDVLSRNNGPKALDVRNVTVERNVIYNWNGPIDVKTPRSRSGLNSVYENLRIVDNVVQDFVTNAQVATLARRGVVDPSQVGFDHNTYWSHEPLPNWFGLQLPGAYSHTGLSFPQWQSQVEPTAHVEAPLFPEPERSVAEYLRLRYGAENASTQGYLERIVLQGRLNWDPDLTAPVINHYIRVGFGLGGVDN